MNSKISTKSSIFKWLGILVTIAMVVTNLSVLAGASSASADPSGFNITAATGGTNISIDTTSDGGTGAFSSDLSGPVITEASIGQMQPGYYVLTIPSWMEFDTTRGSNISTTGGTGLTLAVTNPLPAQHTLTFQVTAASTSAVTTVAVSLLRVRPDDQAVHATDHMTLTYKTSLGDPGTTYDDDLGDFSTVPGALDHMDVIGPVGSVTAGTAFDVTVKAADKFDNTVTSYTGTVHFVSSDPYPAVLPSDTAFQAGWSGIHTFTNGVTLKTTPSQTITVNDVGSGKNGTSTAITVNPASPATLTFNQPPLSGGGTVDSPLATQPIIKVVDAYGNNVADNTVVTAALEVGHGTGVLRNTTANTSGGLATFTNLGYSKSGEAFGITFSCGAATPLSTSPDLLPMTVGAESKLLWGTQPGTSPKSTDTWGDFTVEITDQFGNQTTSTDSVTIIPSAGSLGGNLMQAAIAGLATFNGITDTTTGSLTLTATSGSLTATPASNQITVDPGALDHFTVTGATTATAGDAGHQLTIKAYDVNGNLKTDYTGDQTLTFTGANVDPLGAAPSVSDDTGIDNIAFTNPTVIHFTAGVSDAGGLMKLYTAETAHVAANQGGKTTPTTLDVTVSPALAATLSLTGGAAHQPANGGSDTVDGALTTQPIVHVTDAYGNTVANGTTVSATRGNDGTGYLHDLSGHTVTLTATTSGGDATFANVGYSKSGEAFNIIFSANGQEVTSNDVTALAAGAESKLDWGTQPATSPKSTDTWTAFTVKIEDQYGNQTADTDSVTIAPSAGT
jgi:hypothetical protein